MNLSKNTISVNNLFRLGFLCLTVAHFGACTQEGKESEQKEEVSVIFNNPTSESWVIQARDTLYISGTIVSDVNLHGYEISVFETENPTDRWLTRSRHTHGQTIPFEISIPREERPCSSLTFSMKVAIDHNGNELEFKRQIICQ